MNHDGLTDVLDILSVLNAFQGTFNNLTITDVDIGGCIGDGKIDLTDILAVLDAFQGVDECCDRANPR